MARSAAVTAPVCSGADVTRAVALHPADERDRLCTPRDDALVREVEESPGTFGLVEGPFAAYRRTVTDADDGQVQVAVECAVRPLFWGRLFAKALARELVAAPHRWPQPPWWAPAGRLDRRAAEVIGLLLTISLVGGYLGTVLTQTATFAAAEFDVGTGAQADLLSAVRASIAITLALMVLADRVGRRRVLAFAAVAGIAATASGAFAPSLLGLGATQVVARGFAGALLLLIAIMAAEEMPAGSRAWAVSVLAMCQALGAGMCLWALPLADIGGDGSSSWRALFVLPLLFLPLVVIVHRHLPESRRFERLGRSATPPARLAGHGRRFWLLAATLFLLALFATPASQLGNDFLKEARGFSGAQIAAFTLVTATPAGIGIVVGGRMADVRGRRSVAAAGVAAGTVLSVIAFSSAGWALWVWTLVQNVVSAVVVPSLGVYRPELFPTGARGRAAGALELFGLLGAVAGLQLVGGLVDGGSSYGSAFALAAVAPLAVAVLIRTSYPETARLTLEDINPEDAAAVSAPEAAQEPSG
jgi:MFS family permease